jgi:hypothetical protein
MSRNLSGVSGFFVKAEAPAGGNRTTAKLFQHPAVAFLKFIS